MLAYLSPVLSRLTWRWPYRNTIIDSAAREPSDRTATIEALIKLGLQRVDGSRTEIPVERGTTAANILDHESSKLPAGYSAHLVTETAEVLKPNSQVWEAQAVLLGGGISGSC